MIEPVNDEVIENIRIIWNTSATHFLTRVEGVPDELRVLRDFLTITHWGDILFMAEGINQKHGRAMNDSGYRYPEELDEEDEPFSGIQIYDYYDSVVLSEPAFYRLMLRLFQVLIDGATQSSDPVTGEAWWTQFKDVVIGMSSNVSGL